MQKLGRNAVAHLVACKIQWNIDTNGAWKVSALWRYPLY